MHNTHGQLHHTTGVLLGIGDGLCVCGEICDKDEEGEWKMKVEGKDRGRIETQCQLSALIRKC